MDILDRVRRIVAKELDLEPDEIQPGDVLMGSLGADSLSVMQIALAVEEEFDVSVQDEELESLKSVGDVVRAVDGKLGAIAA